MNREIIKKFGFFAVIIFAVIIFASCSKQQPESQDNQQGQDQQQATDPYEGWQTYRNEEYGFEIKYPSFLQVQEFRLNEFEDSIFSVWFKKEKIGGIILHVKEYAFNLDDVKGIHGTAVDKEYISEKIFGDLKMYSYESGDAGCNGNIVYIPNNNRTITISVTDCVEDEIKIRSKEDDILSSFRFIK